MEELKYIVEDRILAELLGVQNFSNKESAILELVKNAFDAGALIMTLKISKNAIEIEDNGCGISREDLLKLSTPLFLRPAFLYTPNLFSA